MKNGRHSRESGNPGFKPVFKKLFKTCVPAFAGITMVLTLSGSLSAAEPLPLKITTREYPHTKSIEDGTVKIPECQIIYSTVSTAQLNRDLDVGSAGDVIEVDFVPYLKRFSAEEKHDWVLVPVFLWREFPHHHVRVMKENHLAVDIPNESLLLWATGILESSPTFKARELWDKTPLSPVSSLPFLFPDFQSAEQTYFARTRIFPIISALAVRKELVDANAWLPEALFIAFSEAKDHAIAAGTVPLPWGEELREKTIELMKANYWSYGVKNNPKTLNAFFKYAHEQGYTKQELKADDVFAPETLQLIDEKGAKN